MWYLIVSIPDLCTLTYFDILHEMSESLIFSQKIQYIFSKLIPIIVLYINKIACLTEKYHVKKHTVVCTLDITHDFDITHDMHIYVMTLHTVSVFQC